MCFFYPNLSCRDQLFQLKNEMSMKTVECEATREYFFSLLLRINLYCVNFLFLDALNGIKFILLHQDIFLAPTSIFLGSGVFGGACQRTNKLLWSIFHQVNKHRKQLGVKKIILLSTYLLH